MRRFLNLSEGFNPYGAHELNCIKFDTFTFSGGEPHIKLLSQIVKDDKKLRITVTHRVNSFNDFGLLCVAVDALRRTYEIDTLHLFIPYFPAARQDRVMVKGESLTVKVYANMINMLGFDKVIIFDPHSEVTPALIDNCLVIDNTKFVEHCMKLIEWGQENPNPDVRLVSVDGGAIKKVKNLGMHFKGKYPIVKCDKTRDVATGQITGFEVYADDLAGADVVMADDICDGGGTFIGLAEELKRKNCGKIYLIVSHGIFSKGFNIFFELFDGVYFTDSITSNATSTARLMLGKEGFEKIHQIAMADL